MLRLRLALVVADSLVEGSCYVCVAPVLCDSKGMSLVFRLSLGCRDACAAPVICHAKGLFFLAFRRSFSEG